ncbi:threonine-phosphate decarboxylase CobD [Chelativorans sp. M5D2P16]|uniref:threonine-phosphate decarboxylase CobD n=1 Tax=Chelativorans sp. M5D2P16 TaxID=3095678 RepID=UPI003A0FDDAF
MASRLEDLGSEVTDHGGSLGRAETLFPGAPKPWLDLSTGINPYSYPLPDFPASAFERLPEEEALRDLADIAARAYGAPAGANVAAAPGTQILLPLVAACVPPGKAAVLSPTYAEHRRAAALAGHDVREVQDFATLFDADLAILVNPNNPDGRVINRADLLALARHMRERGGLLVVDEAFMDVGPEAERLDGDVEAGGIVVLRSFGKFFGLAGLRLGFAIAARPLAQVLRARLGPWAVGGPALAVGRAALSDFQWQAEMRAKLMKRTAALDVLLAESGIAAAGGTPLFRFLRTHEAESLFNALGRDGILVRNFSGDLHALRVGLPGDEDAFDRLSRSLRRWRHAG